MSMPDKWEYPWFAAWDLAFHCVALAHVDPGFAKYQLTLLCREWFQHPNGALPAYEWDFGDVNPPVQAWAALEVFAIDGGRDIDFLSPGVRQAAGQLHLVGEPGGRRRLQPVRGRVPRAWTTSARSTARTCLPGSVLEQSDATGWMATYALAMGVIATVLRHARAATRRRPGAEVPRALRRDPRRHRGTGVCGTRPTGCSTTGSPCADGDGRPGRGPVDGRHHPDAGRGRRRRGAAGPHAGGGQAVRRFPGPGRAARPRAAGQARVCCAASRDTGRCCSASSASTGSSGCSRSCSTPPSSSPPTGCARCRPTTASTPTCSTRPGSTRDDRLRARRVDHRDVRRQLQLAGPGVVPAELPRRRGAASATTGSSATTTPSSTRPGPGQTLPLDADRPGPVGPAGVDLPGRPGRAAAVLRLGRAPAARPAVEGQPRCSPSTSTATTAPGSGASHQTGWTGLVADIIRRRHGEVQLDRRPAARRCATRQDRTMTARRAAGRACSRSGPRPRDGGTNFAVASGGGRRAAVPVRRRRHRDPGRAPGVRRRGVARVRPGRRPRPGLRLPGRPGRTTRPAGCATTRPSCCSTRTPGRSTARSGSGRRCSATTPPTPTARARSTRPAHVPRSLVVDPAFGWRERTAHGTRYADTVIYEVHVKGFTAAHPDVPAGAPGHATPGWRTRPRSPTWSRSGVTTVELLPVHHSVPEAVPARRAA